MFNISQELQPALKKRPEPSVLHFTCFACCGNVISSVSDPVTQHFKLFCNARGSLFFSITGNMSLLYGICSLCQKKRCSVGRSHHMYLHAGYSAWCVCTWQTGLQLETYLGFLFFNQLNGDKIMLLFSARPGCFMWLFPFISLGGALPLYLTYFK